MKKLMVVAAAMLGMAVLAQEAEGANAKEAPRRGPGRGPMMERGMPRGMMPHGMRGGMTGAANDPAVMAVMHPKVAEKVGVSKETLDQMKKIDLDSRKGMREIQEKTRTVMDKQAKLMQEAKPDEAAVMAAIDELFDLRKSMAKAQAKRVLAIKALLTPEQLSKALEEMKAMREERRAKRAAPAPSPEKN